MVNRSSHEFYRSKVLHLCFGWFNNPLILVELVQLADAAGDYSHTVSGDSLGCHVKKSVVQLVQRIRWVTIKWTCGERAVRSRAVMRAPAQMPTL